MGKHGHGNQKSSKRSQRFKAEARKVKPQSNPVKEVNSRALKHNGWVKEVKSIVFISSQAKEASSSMEEAQIVVGFYTKSFSKEAQRFDGALISKEG
ncbi:hypothetical protein Tco_0352641 [Tanacetum coccineum]